LIRIAKAFETMDSWACRLRLTARGEVGGSDPSWAVMASNVSRHQRFRRVVQRIIELGQRDGSIRVDVDAEALPGEIIAFMQGSGVRWFLDPKHFDLAGVERQYFDRLIRDMSVETTVGSSSSVTQRSHDRGTRRAPANQTRRPAVKSDW
jgi:hypothetical protein